MKKLIILFILLSVSSFGQIKKSVLPGALRDSVISIIGYSSANLQLNNLGLSTSINSDLVPDTNLTKSLGTSIAQWSDIWGYDLRYAYGGFISSLYFTEPTGNRDIYLPDASGTLTLNTLSNLGTTAINADLVPQGFGGRNLGNLTNMWGNLYLGSTLFFKASGGIYRTSLGHSTINQDNAIYLPDASGTLALTSDLDDVLYEDTGYNSTYNISLGNNSEVATAGTITLADGTAAYPVLSGYSFGRMAIDGEIIMFTSDTLSLSNRIDAIAPTTSANKSLSNLTATSINAHLIPGVTDYIDLGNLTYYFHGIWGNVFHLKSSITPYQIILTPSGSISASRSISFPDASGTVMLTSDTTSLSDRIDLKLEALDTLSLSNRIDTLEAGSGFATIELDNLGTTAINADLIPDTDETLNLGSNSLRWSNLYGTNVVVDNAVLRYSTFSGYLAPPTLTADQTWTFPNVTGTVALSVDTRIDSTIIFTNNADTLTDVGIGRVAGEIEVRDNAGNITVISPHPVQFDGKWMYMSQRDGEYTVVDWEKFIGAMEKVTGEKYIYKGKLEDIKKEMQ